MYCVQCERFVETKLVRAGPSAFSYILAGLAAFCALPTLVGYPAGALTLLSVVLGAVWAVYVASRRPKRIRVCAACGSKYIVEDMAPKFRRAA